MTSPPLLSIDIVTIFPGYFVSPLSEALMGRAIDAGLLAVRLVDLRRFSEDSHHKVDDEAYGGGPGMVLAAPPVVHCLESLRAEPEGPPPFTIYLSPRGRKFDAALARELSGKGRIIFLCGRYEGMDQRVLELGLIDEEISAGDFVLAGGEAAALVLVEAISRFVPGVVGDADSVTLDSFENGLLDYPHYTRPRDFRGLAVPEVLLSGHHARIQRFRRQAQFEATARHRPDLWKAFRPNENEKELWEEVAGRFPSP